MAQQLPNPFFSWLKFCPNHWTVAQPIFFLAKILPKSLDNFLLEKHQLLFFINCAPKSRKIHLYSILQGSKFLPLSGREKNEADSQCCQLVFFNPVTLKISTRPCRLARHQADKLVGWLMKIFV
jgi:hypothetical protein